MAELQRNARLKMKCDTAANWRNSSLTLHKGEIAIESDTGLMKVGDGTKNFRSLDYFPKKVAVADGLVFGNSTIYVDDTNTTSALWSSAKIISDIENAKTEGIEEAVELAGEHLTSMLGIPEGIATLDSTGKIPAAQLPSYVDDVVEVSSYADLPVAGEGSKVYITLDNSFQYRWSGSAYVQITSGNIVIGTVTGTAYDGGDGALNRQNIQLLTNDLGILRQDFDSITVTDTDSGVTTYKVDGSKINDLSVTGDKIANGTITSDKLAGDFSISSTQVTFENIPATSIVYSPSDVLVLDCGGAN